MATAKTTDKDDLRAEFNALRDEVGQFMKTLHAYERDRARGAKATVSDELNSYGEKARERYEDARAAGEEKLSDVEDKVREQPFASLAIAFGVGFVLSKLVGRD